MHIEEHKSLKKYNTFSIDCNARYFVSIESISDLDIKKRINLIADKGYVSSKINRQILFKQYKKTPLRRYLTKLRKLMFIYFYPAVLP